MSVHPFLAPLSVVARSVVGELLHEVFVACPEVSSRDAVAELRARLDKLVLTADLEVGRKPVHAYDEIRRRLSQCAATGDGAALSWVSESLHFERLPESERERLREESRQAFVADWMGWWKARREQCAAQWERTPKSGRTTTVGGGGR